MARKSKFDYANTFTNDIEAQFKITPTRLNLVNSYGEAYASVTRKSLAKALRARPKRSHPSAYLEGAFVRERIRPGYNVAVDRANGIIAIGCQQFSGDTAKMLRTWALAAA